MTHSEYPFLGWKNTATKQYETSVPKGTRGNLTFVAEWTTSSNSGMEITIGDTDSLKLQDYYKLNYTQDTVAKTMTITFVLKDNLNSTSTEYAEQLLNDFTYQWAVDGSVLTTASGASLVLDLEESPGFTPNSIHYVSITVEYQGKPYTLIQQIRCADED